MKDEETSNVVAKTYSKILGATVKVHRSMDENGVALDDIRRLRRAQVIVQLKRCIRDLYGARTEADEDMIMSEMRKLLKQAKRNGNK